MDKTIKQIADELKIDKQKIYRFIKKDHINESHQKNGVMHYDEKAQSLISSHFIRGKTDVSTSEKSLASASYDILLKQSELLQKELEFKNEQIAGLQRQNEQLTAALEHTTSSLKSAQALHAGTIQQQLTDGKEKEKKRWQFWKNNKE